MSRYLEYHWGGTGIVARDVNWHLDVGILVHDGIAECLRLIKKKGGWDDKFIDCGINKAMDSLRQSFESETESDGKMYRSRSYKEDTDNTSYAKKEAECLVEGLIWCWGKIEGPVIGERYEILLVEKDRTVKVSEAFGYDFRVDAIFREKDTGDGVVYSIKTVRSLEYRQEKNQDIGLQNFTETYAAMKLVEAEKKRLRAKFQEVRGDKDKAAQIKAEYGKYQGIVEWKIRYCNLVKGIGKWNQDKRRVEIQGGLVRGWKKKEDTRAKGPQWVAEWDGFYPQAYEKFEVWRIKGGVRKWLEMLEAEKVYPGFQFITGTVDVPTMRYVYEDEMIENLEMFKAGELEVRDKLRLLKLVDGVPFLYFRRNPGACFWPYECQFVAYCYNPEVRKNPLDNGVKLYQIREPHHPQEKERRKSHGRKDQGTDLRG